MQRIAPEDAFQHQSGRLKQFWMRCCTRFIMVLWIGLSGAPNLRLMSARSSEAPSLLIFSSGVVEADLSSQTRPRAEAVWNLEALRCHRKGSRRFWLS